MAVSVDTGEVGLWDATSKTSLARLPGAPLIAGSASGSTSAMSIAYTTDSRYLAAGIVGASTSSVKVVSIQQKQALQKDLDYEPFSISFSADGLGLAVGEYYYGEILFCTP